MARLQLKVGGIHCSFCSQNIERAYEETGGVEAVMMTGDSERTARAVARKVGIDRVLAGALQDAKVEELGKLQEEDHRVAFVGDGINDATALTRADVRVASVSGVLANSFVGHLVRGGELAPEVDGGRA